MKKQLLLLVAMLLSLVASSHDIEVKNADGVTIYYNWDSDNTGLIVTYSQLGIYYGNVVIPESVYYSGKNFPVTSIGSSAFESCHNLISVTIPNSVVSIGSYAFNNCI